MSSKIKLLDLQRAWATETGASVDARGYLPTIAENLYQPLSNPTYHSFLAGGGSELIDNPLRPAKMKALHSSAALVVNFFDYWTERDPDSLLSSLGLEVEPVIIVFEAQFPTGLSGNPPNLDVALRFSDGRVVGIESKFSEWLAPKPPNKELFKPKYFPNSMDLWSATGLPSCQALATRLHAGSNKFRYLDAAQLLKHALGLATNHPGQFELSYLFYEWPGPESLAHRTEVELFESLVKNDFRFRWNSYQEIFRTLEKSVGADHTPYITYLHDRYFP